MTSGSAGQASDSATSRGPRSDTRARGWVETWEGAGRLGGWGTSVYAHVVDRTKLEPGTRLLDRGCGAGRFPHRRREAPWSPASMPPHLVEMAGDTRRRFTGRLRLMATPWHRPSLPTG